MKRIIALLLCTIMVFSLAACGDKGGSGDKVTLKIGMPNGDDLTPYSILEKFKAENPNIEIVLDEAPWNDFKSKLKMQIGGGNAPDVFFMDSGYTATLGALGAALDLSDRIEKDLNTDDYIGALYAAKDAEGHVWGVPHGLNSIALYYNEKLFDEAGIEYPNDDWTFEQMIDAANKLTTKPDATGASSVYGFGQMYNITQGWLPFVLATGGAPLDETRTKSNFKDPKTIEGIKKFTEFATSPATTPLPWINTNGGLEASFYMGKVAMFIGQTGSAKTINQNAPEGFRYNVTTIPKGWDGEKHSIYVPNSWVINSKATPEAQEAAWKWLKFYLNEESQMTIAETCPGGYPIHKKAIEYCASIDTVPKNREAFFKLIDTHGITLFENPTWEEWKPEVDQIFKDLKNAAITVDEAIEQMDSKVSEILAG